MSASMLLSPILDNAAISPGLAFDELARVLGELIVNAAGGQLTVGIFGGYGSGKTTLMRAIKNCVERRDDRSLLSVEFNAWRHDHEPRLFLPFLSAIYGHEQIGKTPTLADQVVAAARAFVRGVSFEMTVGIAKMSFAGDKTAEAEEKSLKGDAEGVLKGYTDVHRSLCNLTLDQETKAVIRRIVVFIDDLDRCVPQKAFALLEALKSFMDIPGFIFVLGLDPRAIETYLPGKYGRHLYVTPEEYLEKLVQIPIHLPRVTSEGITTEMTRLFEAPLSAWATAVLNDVKDMEKFLPCNLRQLKRMLNVHGVLMAANEKSIEEKRDETMTRLNSKALLAILTIQLRWPFAYWAIHRLKEDFDGMYGKLRATQEQSDRDALGLPGKVVTQLRNDDFDHVYKILSGALQNMPGAIRGYLERLGWPISIESRLSAEFQDD